MNGKADEDARKLFLGGLNLATTDDGLRAYFGHYGEVSMATVKMDMQTGRSRGFGFLIFADRASVNQVLDQAGGRHTIDGKEVEAKLATPQSSDGGGGENSTKIFVGGIEPTTTKDELTEVFSQRGNVTDVFLPVDRESGQGKGFAFVTFDDGSIASLLCSEGKIMIGGKECDMKRAKNKNESRGGGRGGRGGFGGGRGGGRGGYGGGYDQYGGYGGGYDQYNSGYNNGYGGGGQPYGGQGYGYDQYGGGGGYDQGYGGGYGEQSGYGGGEQYKMRGNRGGRGGFNPY